MRNSKNITVAMLVALLMWSLPVLAADIDVKWGGPSGHGSMTFWAPKFGQTNLVLNTNGTVTIPGGIIGGSSMSNLTVGGSLTVNGAGAFTSKTAEVSSWVNIRGITTLSNLVCTGTVIVTGTTTLSNLNVTGDCAVIGNITGGVIRAGQLLLVTNRSVCVSPNTTMYALEKGSNSAIAYGTANHTVCTGTFTTAFSDAPSMWYRYTIEGLVGSNLLTTTTTGYELSNCQTSFVWGAIGTR